MKKYAVVMLSILAAGCVSKNSWVTPESIKDQQRYNSDYQECMSSSIDEVKRLMAYSTVPSDDELRSMGHSHMRACLTARGYKAAR